jgi:hypothetical protein
MPHPIGLPFGEERPFRRHVRGTVIWSALLDEPPTMF